MTEIADFRKAKDRYFGDDENLPLTPEQRQRFQGLQYFAENEKLQFVLVVEEFPAESKDEIQMATSSGDSATHTRWGQLKFEVGCEPVELIVYLSVGGDGYFLPFMDATTGGESYSDGRYLDLPDSGDGRLLADFNYAYNPYRAYNSRWICPISPLESRLKVAIDVEEKVFPDVEEH